MIKSILYIICLFLCPFQFSIWSVIQGFIYIYIYFFFPILYHKTKGLGGSMIAKSLQSCPTLCDPMDGSPPGSPVPGILQARTLELAAISFSSAWKWKVKVKSLSRVRPSATPWTAAYQAPPSMAFSRQEYWSGVPLPSLSMIGAQKTNCFLLHTCVLSRFVSNFFWPHRL